ncbi:MAG: alpha-2-macroglobulin family protein [Candidatus Aminicenantes bacterium]|nr:alpha-2-macroglobulin family protein [Candidatus Aminicenantes bacterium]
MSAIKKKISPSNNKSKKPSSSKHSFFRAIFGQISWKPPSWIKVIGKSAAKVFFSFNIWINKHKKSAIAVGILFFAAIFGGVFLYVWFSSRPEPVKFSFSFSTPGATVLAEELEPYPVQVTFNGSVARLDQVGKQVDKGIILTPPFEGQWLWTDDSSLKFTPALDWPISQKFTVEFEPSLFPAHVKLESYNFEFKTADFSITIPSFSFYENPADPKIKKVVATVKFSHSVDQEEFKKRTSLILQEEKKTDRKKDLLPYGFTVSYGPFNGEAYIHSDPITIPENDGFMRLIIAKGVMSSKGGPPIKEDVTGQVRIPGMYNYFNIRRASVTLVENEKMEMEQVLVINTSTGVLETEMQKNTSAFLLPKDRPAYQNRPAKKNYRWNNASEIGPEIIKVSQPLELGSIPTDREFATMHSFKFSAPVNRYIFVKIEKGTLSYGGYVLAAPFDSIEKIPSYPQTLEIMHEGALLSLSGEKKISILTRNLEAVQIEINRVLPGQLNHLISQTRGNFNDPYFRNYNFSSDNISDRWTEIKSLKKGVPGSVQYTALDFSQYCYEEDKTLRGLFFVKVYGYNLKQKRTTSLSDKRFILITDLGLLAKKTSSGEQHIFIQSISSGEPVRNADVEVLGLNGLPVLSAQSDQNGHVRFPPLDDFKREKEPVAFLVKKGTDLSFLPVDRYDRNLNFSRFDTGGVYLARKKDALNAYLFSDRGIYRPGDTFHVGVIVKSSDWKTDLNGVPVEAAVLDPRSLEIMKKSFKLSSTGFEEISYSTQNSSPTGTYTIGLYIVKDEKRSSLIGSTTVRVEEFLPDRMKIRARFSKSRLKGWVSPENLKALVDLKNLFGTPASGRKISARITLSPSYPSFREYRDYHFFDPLLAEKSFSERLDDKKSNDEGEAEFILDLDRFEKSTYRVSFLAEGFEAEGGRSVTSLATQLVSPLPFLIGYKPDGDLRYIRQESKRTVELIAVDPELKKTGVNGLKSHIIEQRHVSSLVRQRDGTYKYQSVIKEFPVYVDDLSIPEKGLPFPLPSSKPGDFLLVIKDKNETELHKIHFTVVGDAGLTRSLEKTAELQLKLNKTDFSPGEIIEMQILAPYLGSGLITIECDRIYGFKWFKASANSTIQTIRVPENMEGNGYVNVAFIRDMSSDEIFMSPLSYGVAPFSISREGRINPVDLEVPEIFEPGQSFPIKYKSRDPAKIIVFAVDEGILQVAGYQTPDPHSFFFKKRALQVRTSQILDLILPEISLLKEFAASGGGYEGEEDIGKNLNPFKRKQKKPVVFWSGMMDSDQTQREAVYRVPDYFNGTLRVMAVAVSQDKIGTAEKKTIIRGPFVISPNVPTFAAPGDTFEISVNIANNLENLDTAPDIQLELAVSEHLQIVGSPRTTLKIEQNKDATHKYTLQAKDVLGAASLTFSVEGGGKSLKYSSSLSIRPPVPYRNLIQTGYIKKDKKDIPITRTMYTHYRKLSVSASLVPMVLAHGLNVYLEEFPYECTEQLTSRAFAALISGKYPEFGYSPEKRAMILDQAIQILQARQNEEGAFGFWAANSHVSDFQVVYALHFLTEAKAQNIPIPMGVQQRGLQYLKKILNSDINSIASARTHAYAAYILTLNGIVTTSSLNDLVKKLESEMPSTWEKDLTGITIAAVYKLHKRDGEANSLIKKSRPGDEQEADYNSYYDSLIRDAQYLTIISRHFPALKKTITGKDLLYLVDPVTEGTFNTTSAAYAVLALDAYIESTGTLENLDITVSETRAENEIVNLVLGQGLFPKTDFSAKANKISINNPSDHHLFYQLIQSGFDKELPMEAITQNLEVFREYRDESGNIITKTNLGSEIEVRLKVRTLNKKILRNIALVDLLPGGFEVVLDKTRASNSTWAVDYMDIREDRVVLYGTAGPDVKEYSYRIKAVSRGRFKVPPLFGESMYDRTVQAQSLGGDIIIE